MDDDEWREWAIAVGPHLRTLLPDGPTVTAVETAIAAALAGHDGGSRAELRRILVGHDPLRRWVREQRAARRRGYRSVHQSVAVAQRHLAVDFYATGRLGTRLPLIVQVVRTPTDRTALLRPFVLSGRTTLNISVSAGPGLRGVDSLDQDLLVPAEHDSDHLRFPFVLVEPGRHRVVVRAFLGGSCLGQYATEISVSDDAATEPTGPRTAPLRQLAREPGEATLEVSACADGHSFRLVCDVPYERVVSRRDDRHTGTVIERIAAEIHNLASKYTVFTDPLLVRKRLTHLGAEIWNDGVPVAIREQLWTQLPAIRYLSVISDVDVTPWELLYSAEHDSGKFLVERVPVLRRVDGQDHHPRQLRLTNAGYVVPPGSPPEAHTEIAAIRERVGPRVADRGVVADWGGLSELIDGGGFDLLHLACHNSFDPDSGSRLAMRDGPFRPSDLEVAVQRRSLADTGPLVFFNACRSAGEVRLLGGASGWATRFMRAGAAAFVGALWAVRSSSARTFAESFYGALLDGRLPIGAASAMARESVMFDDGDPTWLAYTVYGNPAATVEPPPGQRPEQP